MKTHLINFFFLHLLKYKYSYTMKIPFNEWVNSMSFMLDDNFDNTFMNSIVEKPVNLTT